MAIKIGFSLITLGGFRLNFKKFDTILFLLSAQFLFLKRCSELLNLAFGCEMGLFFDCNLFKGCVQFLLLRFKSLFVLLKLNLHLLLKYFYPVLQLLVCRLNKLQLLV